MDVYTEEFYQLLARTNLMETNDQLVSRFIGGLRLQFQDVLNLFSPVSVSEAHQRAVLLERQFIRRPSGPFVTPTQRVDRISAPNDVRPVAGRGSAATTAPRQPTANAPGSSTRSGACFSCGEFGHRHVSCPRVGCGLLVSDDINEEQQDFPIYDDDDVLPVEHIVGDVGQSLVLRRACLAPKQPAETEQRHQLFESTCTINGKICRFIVDSGSCENIIAADAVTKLALVTEKHPHPYSLAWLQRGNNVTVDRRVQVQFSIGSKYVDMVWCDIVPMDACHLLLGRPWQLDRGVLHDGRTNTYTFIFSGVKMILMPSILIPPPSNHENSVLLLQRKDFMQELSDARCILLLVAQDISSTTNYPSQVSPLLQEFLISSPLNYLLVYLHYAIFSTILI